MKKRILLSIFIIIGSIAFCNTVKNIIDKTVRYDNWQGAKQELESYLQNNSTDSYAYSVYAAVLNELKLYDEAIIAVRSAINYEESSKKKSELYFNLGNYYYNKKVTKTALEMYDKSIKLNERLAPPYYMIGKISYENKNYDDTISNWKRYILLTDNIEKKSRLQEILSRFEQKLLEDKLKAEEEKRKKEEFLKNLLNELGDQDAESKSFEEDKDKAKDTEIEIEEID